MAKKYQQYEKLNLPELAQKIQDKWTAENTFDASMKIREGATPFVFFEGPPSANGMPGIHHALARSVKDLFCRYKTLQGFQVKRKAGWDTHGLPIELGVEKELKITKEDIGKKLTIEEYNQACKTAVMRYTDVWNKLTVDMGYWVDMEDPYITYEPKYMETVWWLLKEMYTKDLIYKGYTIQPYSPKAGTGLSSHEINQPGCYKDVKDTSIVAQFRLNANQKLPFNVAINSEDVFVLAWTTTPWTLPSNTALTVGPKIEYSLIKTFNQYTFEPMTIIMATALKAYQFGKLYVEVAEESELSTYKSGDKTIPCFELATTTGAMLEGLTYEQLMPYVLPNDNPEEAFRIILGDFVTTEDGTGIVHTAPTFGADDMRVAKEAGVPPMLIKDENDNLVPLVDLQGKFRKEMGDALGGMYVKNEYYNDGEAPERSADVQIAILLKEQNRAFKVEKYEHSYPHCWRTDKPILYYPLDSWFIKVSEHRERLMALNDTINWKPESTGTGRFGKWLEGANDWNLSRSRYWGIPIPIWRTEDKSETICIGSVEELYTEIEKAIVAGVMTENPYASFEPGNMDKANYAKLDLHKHHVDKITLVSTKGEPMKRESDLIDVWFDSGSMPYAQWHYPFENKELIENQTGYPADFIAEGVDQTRGWFYTLHTISTLVFDKVAYRNVISNGLVLDKNGQKMSKSKGNTVDPFATLEKYGPDATRWYMITNAQPWDNLKFDLEGIGEVQRKFFGTLYNTYGFFALYANVDGFNNQEAQVALANRPEIDRWVLSKLNTLIKEVEEAFDTYEPTKAGRLIQDFVSDQLSNWYVRLCRRRFWKSDDSQDKLAAYQTLYMCLETVSILASPIAPFFCDQLFCDLNAVSGNHTASSVHLANFPTVDTAAIDLDLEARMEIAQRISSLGLALRKKEKLRVRQPLQKIIIPVLDQLFADRILKVKDLILSELNIKEMELLAADNTVFIKSIKPNFKTIGKKYGQQMKAITAAVNGFSSADILAIETQKGWNGTLDGVAMQLDLEDFEIQAQDIPGYTVASDNEITVALDVTLNEALISEGIAREIVNRVQTLRKDSGLEVTDRISLVIETSESIANALAANMNYICDEVLADKIEVGNVANASLITDIVSEGDTKVALVKN